MPLPLWVPMAVAAIAALGVLVAASLTAYATERRERRARLAEAESQRLAELADAALDLRETTFARAGRTAVAAQRAEALFVARAEAVRSARVRDLAGTWRRRLLDGDADDDSAELFALLREIGRARREVL